MDNQKYIDELHELIKENVFDDEKLKLVIKEFQQRYNLIESEYVVIQREALKILSNEVDGIYKKIMKMIE